jgi:ABC-type molybdate transport system permease subunit
LAFWGGLSLLESSSEINKLIYCLINLCLILISILFQRKAFIIFGAMGVFVYIGHLARKVFADSLLFPVALCVIGCLIMYFGIQYRKHYKSIEEKLAKIVPDRMQYFLPPHRS